MAQSDLDRRKREQLEDLLKRNYETVYEYQKHVDSHPDLNQRRYYQQEINDRLLPRIRSDEIKYAHLLVGTDISEETAADLVQQISRAADSLQGSVPAGSPERKAIDDLKAELSKPGNASAKLKLNLPIIPLIASYEITFETAGLMGIAWKRVKDTFSNPHQPRH